ncbi:MAG TPA: LuxR C-terminal-related transcriptional regulator [Mobilitalea sp.]|nr:LuxR C-terminal-related transcriptional regulator [Mobilitalea sp.]
MEDTLKESAQDKLIMPFVESAPHIFELLQIVIQKKPENEYVKRILSLCQQYNQIIHSQLHTAVVMTKREISILSLSAEGLNRKEIANHLFITEETVKSHFKNIYQKLDVSSKLSAIKIAQDRGYLESVERI